MKNIPEILLHDEFEFVKERGVAHRRLHVGRNRHQNSCNMLLLLKPHAIRRVLLTEHNV